VAHVSDILSEFRVFFDDYQGAWNRCDAEQIASFCAPELVVRWAYPGNQTSDWGYREACDGWRQVFEAYAGRNPTWNFHEVCVTRVSENEVLAVFWVTFELDGGPTKEINLFVETFRRDTGGWRLIRSYVESSIPKKYVNPQLI
jgi:ketosteroid isomerase-like protein